MNEKWFSDQREHQRFRAPERAFAVMKNHASRLGQIIDISMGGLATEYIANGELADGLDQVDIFFPDSDFLMKGIPARTVADFIVDPHNPFSFVPMRRRGIQFLGLGNDQALLLKSLINWCAVHG
ncbi:MAG: PilZ domain-containing protein [Deltaproteobacteria bacterium]|nr:PilZ domain-containing protein [Deltaproteobacteria bacterium]